MFGYIKPYTPELKIKESEAFKSLYCGLCHQMGDSFKVWTRLTLSYDFVFLAMLYYSNKNQIPEIKKGRCAVNPLSKILVSQSDEGLVYAADIAIIMMYYKIKDNISDTHFLENSVWKSVSKLAKSDWEKAALRRPSEDRIIKEMMEKQWEVERRKSSSLDEACEPTAFALSKIVYSFSSGDEKQAKLGYLIGRYIYMCDATEDLKDDIKKGNYNPFIYKYPDEIKNDKSLENITNKAKESLFMTIGEIGKIVNDLEFPVFSPIINNIAEFGLKNSVLEILKKKGGMVDEPL